MRLEQLEAVLRHEPAFSDLAAWAVTPVLGGSISPHTYRFQREGADYFVKEVKPNEARTLRLLAALDLCIAPRVIYPALLQEAVLVSEFIVGEHPHCKRLEPQLIVGLAELHNALNDEERVRRAAPEVAFRLAREDDGFYRRSITRCMDEGYAQLLRLKRHGLAIVDEWVALADHLRARQARLSDAFVSMPFAWLHHDFREGSILGHPQRLIDWGSSYGHGPFLFDLAPFLVEDPAGLALFCAHSNICASVDRETIWGWLQAANGACFFGFLLWRLEHPSLQGRFTMRPAWELDADVLDAVLSYEIQPFRGLLAF
ncbi:MAG: hypothetical protein JXA74_01900 [Anaerolineae bacterium]|nr:hypothetical protein [Anaerolineae bacterium]